MGQLPVPEHVACVMDGNGRWASTRGLPTSAGHAAGEAAVLEAIEAAVALRVRWLTLYTFSTENWQRSRDEVAFILSQVEDFLDRNGDRFHSEDIRVRFMGRKLAPLPSSLIAAMEAVEAQTRHNTGLTLTFALNYGGQNEIADAAVRAAEPLRLSRLRRSRPRCTSQTCQARTW